MTKLEVLHHLYLKGHLSRQQFLLKVVKAQGKIIHAGRYIYYRLGKAQVVENALSGRSFMIHNKLGVMFLE